MPRNEERSLSNGGDVPTRNTSTRVAGIAGVLGVGLPVVGLLVLPIWKFPGTTISAANVTAFVVQHRTSLRVVMVLNTAGVGLWMVFGAAVWARLRQVSSDGFLAACFAFGLVSFVTLLLVGFVAMFITSYRAPDVSDVRLLYDLTFGLLAISGIPTAIALSCYAIVAFQHPAIPRSTAWLAVTAAAAHVFLLFSLIIPSGFFSLEGGVITVIPGLLFAWIVATSLPMLSVSSPMTSLDPAGGLQPKGVQ